MQLSITLLVSNQKRTRLVVEVLKTALLASLARPASPVSLDAINILDLPALLLLMF